jgi:hypothetical protein
MWLIGNAVYDKDIHYSEVTVKRGQYLRSFRKLQEDLRYTDNNKIKIPSLGTIKRTVDKLLRKKMIAILETPLGTLFTITNYEKYQSNGVETKQFEDQAINKMGGLEQDLEQGLEQQRNSNGTILRKNNKEKNNIYVLPGNSLEEMFNKFWILYPKKAAKKKAHSSFIKIKDLDNEKFDKIIQVLNTQIKSIDWQKDNGQYIPHPTSWINAERWDDEITLPNNQQKQIPEYLQ